MGDDVKSGQDFVPRCVYMQGFICLILVLYVCPIYIRNSINFGLQIWSIFRGPLVYYMFRTEVPDQ